MEGFNCNFPSFKCTPLSVSVGKLLDGALHVVWGGGGGAGGGHI